MSRVRDRYDPGNPSKSDALHVSAHTARIVQDGTAIDTIGAALDMPPAQRTPLGVAILEAYVAAWDAGQLEGVRCIGSLRGKYAHYLTRQRSEKRDRV